MHFFFKVIEKMHGYAMCNKTYTSAVKRKKIKVCYILKFKKIIKCVFFVYLVMLKLFILIKYIVSIAHILFLILTKSYLYSFFLSKHLIVPPRPASPFRFRYFER